MKKKVAIVVGTRPEVIKMAPVYNELKKSEKIEPILISTAQHRQMLDQTMSIFGLKPHYDMNIMQPGQTLSELTAKIIFAWENFYKTEKLDAVLVQGDTTTVLATTISAFYHRVPIGHIEAGLRTGDLYSPFPEEMNRKLTDPISKWCFVPTADSKRNLISENILEQKCFITGNTVIDSLLWMRNKLASSNVSATDIAKKCNIPTSFKETFLETCKPWILVTGHRRENFGSGFENICTAIRKIVDIHPEVGILYPVHLNPNVQEPVNRILKDHSRISLISPVDYESFVWLMNKCSFVLSDSGGIQEEAPTLGKPVLVMRNTTERPEGVKAGTCVLVGTDVEKILEEVSILLNNKAEYFRRSKLKNPYGDGTASIQIRKVLENEF